MTEDAATAVRKPFTLWKAIGVVLLAVGLLLALYIYQGHRGLSKLRQQLTAQGEILDWRQLGTNAAPHQANGMPDFIAAAEALSYPPSGIPYFPRISPGVRVDVTKIQTYPSEIYLWNGTKSHRLWVSNLWSELRPLVEGHRHTWQLAVEATTNTTMLHELNWSQGHQMKIPPTNPPKTFAGWTRMAIACDLQRGAHGEAMNTATNALHVLYRIKGVPTALGELVRRASLSIFNPTVWWLLNHRWPDKDLANLQHALEAVKIVEPALRALELERAQTIQAWEKSLDDPTQAEKILETHECGIRLWQVAPSHHDLGWYLQRFQVEIEAAREANRKRSFRLFQERVLPSPEPPWIYLMSRTFYGTQEPYCRLMFRAQAGHEIAITAVALHRFHARHEQFPRSLNELVPDLLREMPVDWMDGKPLRYQRKTPNEFRLWSVGKDGIDQGGDPNPPKGIASWWLNGRDYVWPTTATPEETKKYAADSVAKWKAATSKSGP